MSLVRRLAWDRLDIVGDVHGEIDALRALLHRLGCDLERARVERPLVFVGDLVDRGPDSVRVVEAVRHLVEAGVAQVVIGNHELNLLNEARKEGNGWYFGHDDGWHEQTRRVPFASRAAHEGEQRAVREFLVGLPLALESPSLRIVHAAWGQEAIAEARAASSLSELIARQPTSPPEVDLRDAPTREALHDARVPVAFHAGLAAVQASRQNQHAEKVLTSGYERAIAPGTKPEFIAGKWRMLERDPWWERYHDEVAVVFGHYWRRRAGSHGVAGKPDPLAGIAPTHWFGASRRAFCVDYSVGSRYKARHRGDDPRRDFGLAALRWPERILFFDDTDGPTTTA